MKRHGLMLMTAGLVLSAGLLSGCKSPGHGCSACGNGPIVHYGSSSPVLTGPAPSYQPMVKPAAAPTPADK